jgi:hypothetical protein
MTYEQFIFLITHSGLTEPKWASLYTFQSNNGEWLYKDWLGNEAASLNSATIATKQWDGWFGRQIKVIKLV